MKKLAITAIAMLVTLMFAGISAADGKMPCGKDKSDCMMMEKAGMPCDKTCMTGGMKGMRGGVDGMTWPRMNKSCRTPDFYLDNADALGISDVQADSLRKLDEGLRRDMIVKGAAVKALELDLSNIVTKTDFRYDDAAAKLTEIEKARTELRSTVIKASASARDLLAPEQLDKVRELCRPGRGCRTAPPDTDGMDGMEGMEGMEGVEGVPSGMRERMMEDMRERMMR